MINFWFVVIGLVSCFLLWKVGFNDFFIDNYRERLFAIRLELVELVRAGKLSHKDPAYCLIRLVLNGLIRYSHRVTFGRFLHTVIWKAIRKSKGNADSELDLSKQLRLSISKLPTETQKEINQLLARVHHETALLMLWTSGLLKVVFLLHYIARFFRDGNDKKPLQESVTLMQRDAYLAARSDGREPAMV